MNLRALSIGTVLAVMAGIGLASTQTLPPASVDGLVSAAKNAAGTDWAGTFLRLCIAPPPAAQRGRAAAAPSGGATAAARGGRAANAPLAPPANAGPAGPPPRSSWYA